MAVTAITTDVDIINLALLRLGLDRITTVDDDNDRANLAKYTYLPILYALQREHQWNFLAEYVELDVRVVGDAVYRWDYAYSLPADYGKIWELDGQSNLDGDTWEVAGDYLLTDLYTEAYSYDFTVTDGSGFIAAVGHAVETGDAIIFEAEDGATLPTGVNATDTFYAIDEGADVFSVDDVTPPVSTCMTPATGSGGTLTAIHRMVRAKHTKLATDVTLFTPQFIDMFAARLETEWAERLVKSAALQERKDSVHDRKYGLTRGSDGQSSPPQVLGKFGAIENR